jgi:hypothetical protein
VEAFFNLAWVAITVALFSAWITSGRLRNKRSRLPSVGVQLVAVALLAAILLPVISLTDDLQATPTLADSEHLSRRADIQPTHDHLLHALPVALAQWVSAIPTIYAQPRAILALDQPPSSVLQGYLRVVGSRPPPSV